MLKLRISNAISMSIFWKAKNCRFIYLSRNIFKVRNFEIFDKVVTVGGVDRVLLICHSFAKITDL